MGKNINFVVREGQRHPPFAVMKWRWVEWANKPGGNTLANVSGNNLVYDSSNLASHLRSSLLQTQMIFLAYCSPKYILWVSHYCVNITLKISRAFFTCITCFVPFTTLFGLPFSISTFKKSYLTCPFDFLIKSYYLSHFKRTSEFLWVCVCTNILSVMYIYYYWFRARIFSLLLVWTFVELAPLFLQISLMEKSRLSFISFRELSFIVSKFYCARIFSSYHCFHYSLVKF